MSLRKWILQIHLYSGLLCFWYIIIFAVSSLQFHHHFKFMEPGNTVAITRESSVDVQPENDKKIFAVNLQNELKIPGWTIPWKTSRDSSGIFHTVIQNPKAVYTLDYNPTTSRVTMKSESNGFWRVVNSLHANTGQMPHAPLLIFWKYYTWLCLAVVVFAIISGFWLWAGKPGNKKTGIITLSGAVVLSVLLMSIVYIYG